MRFAAVTSIGQLVRLELGNVTSTGDPLIHLLEEHARTLRDITVRCMALYEVGNEDDEWEFVFDTLREMDLTSLRLACLYRYNAYNDMYVLEFSASTGECNECGESRGYAMHSGRPFYQIDCEHVVYESEDGSVPKTFDMRLVWGTHEEEVTT